MAELGKITINMDAKFIEWWKTIAPHIQENQTIMVIAWWAWEKSREVLKEVTE